jgi:D-beta-D-heptose 7-phosphate kinase/D-beta-D-heptose 1-phosphate adenosyltransferase
MSSFPGRVELDSYEEICADIRKNCAGKIVLANGCFDILHVGHLAVFKRASMLAGEHGTVVVAINSDESIRRLKGPSRPIFSESQRSYLVRNLVHVDAVIIFDEDTPRELIDALRPDVIVKGGDYRPEDVIGSDIADIEIVALEPGCSTTEVIERIRHA